MRTHDIPSCYRKSKRFLLLMLIIPPDLALLSTLIGSNYPCLELISMVPKVFEPLKFDCIWMVGAGLLSVSWPIGIQLVVFFCSSVSVVLLTPGVSTRYNCRVLVIASSQSFH